MRQYVLILERETTFYSIYIVYYNVTDSKQRWYGGGFDVPFVYLENFILVGLEGVELQFEVPEIPQCDSLGETEQAV